MSTLTDPPPPWWRHDASLKRVLADLLSAELASMRPALRRVPPPWPDTLDLAGELGADSLELMGLASAMESLLGLRRGADAPLLAHTRLADWLAVARDGLDRDGSMLSFRTSGSSGAPKTVVHESALLWQEARFLASLFPGRRRILSMVPAHHIYGFLFSVLLPQALGLAPEAVLDLRGHAPGAVAGRLRAGDLVLGFPDFWRAFAEAGAAPALDVTGVSSTAPCPPEVARGVRAAGLARLVQVYGSSETAGVGWREDPDAPYVLFPYWSRAADPGQLLRQGPDGQARSYPLQDRLAWSGECAFRPEGRIDHAVQVGGVNVFPAYVAEVLRMHPGVLEAAVRPMRPDEGYRLKAFVVPRADAIQGADALRGALDNWMRERLSAPECPAAYSFGSALPRTASGKPADWIIDAWD
jgi:4-coumarate--CoA ligase